jgi:hypothetical protein
MGRGAREEGVIHYAVWSAGNFARGLEQADTTVLTGGREGVLAVVVGAVTAGGAVAKVVDGPKQGADRDEYQDDLQDPDGYADDCTAMACGD